MSTVLDASAIIALAMDDQQRSGPVESALTNETCYVSAVAAAEMYSSLLRHAGRQTAEHWLGFVMSEQDIVVEARIDQSFIELVGEARLMSNVSLSCAFSAVLARRLGVPVITASGEFHELERRGFCQVRWL